jgi:serine/threonine protein kinase/ribosomal protein S18 acetylase RimI-like enzyme
VVLCEHKKTREEIAIKRVEFASFEDANMQLNEAHRLKQLNHKNILKYHNVFLNKYSTETQFVCLCVEYCPGGDLSRVIQRSWSNKTHMNENDILRYTLEISEGLEYLHEQGIIHRDLKPQNVLLAQDETLKIGDFGISRVIGSSLVKTQCGTPNYMSWEMLNKEAYNEMTDMYSLGVVILQMLTGKAMMLSIELGKNPGLFSDLEKELTRKYGYSSELIRLAERLVHYTPSERPTATETLKAIRRIMMKKRRSSMTSIDRLPNAYKLFDTGLKLKIFMYLDISDMYQVMQVCKSFYAIWDEYWWEGFCLYTKQGDQIVKEYAVLGTNVSQNRSSFRSSFSMRRFSDVDNQSPIRKSPSNVNISTNFGWRRTSDVNEYGGGDHSPVQRRSRSNSAKARLIGESNNMELHHNKLHLRISSNDITNLAYGHSPPKQDSPKSTSAMVLNKRNYKEFVFSYFKVHRPQKTRARKNMGKRVVTEIHPGQIEEASEFLAKTFMQYGNEWVRYAFGLPSPDIEDLDEHIEPAQPQQQATSNESSPEQQAEAQPPSNVEISIPELSAASSTVPSILEDSTRLEQMKWFFQCAIRYGIKYGRVWVSTFYKEQGDQEIQGLSIWQHPYNGTKLTFWKLLRVGIMKGLKNLGFKLMYRLLKAIDYAETVHSRLQDQKTKPHWTLFMLAVKQEATNNGIGASVLLPVMRSADEQSIPIYCTVYSPSLEMIKFYKRHGFEIVEKVIDAKVGPPFYAMIRYCQ